jgi:cell shape-determining protein MreC
MPLIKVKDNPNLYRDAHSRAVINTDNLAYQEYIQTRERLKQQHEMLLNNVQEIDSLKDDVREIKSLLQSIALKLQGKE